MDLPHAFEFQLNTIQRLTETKHEFQHLDTYEVPIKHYPTINWNIMRSRNTTRHTAFQLNTIQRLTETKPPRRGTARRFLFQLNTIQRLTETGKQDVK